MNGSDHSGSIQRLARHGWKRRGGMLASEAGTVTVEFMMWMPIVFLVILFAVDVSLIYLKQGNMWNVARDTARRLSVSSTLKDADAQTYAISQLFGSLQTACASTCVTTSGATLTATDKIVTIQIGLCQASLFGIVGCFDNNLKLTARVTMASEY